MNEDTAFVAITTRYLLEQRKRHVLPYINTRTNDYAFSSLRVIPHVLNRWRTHGLDLSRRFVIDLWEEHAEKQEGQQRGELHRAAKLTLDSFRAWYDTQAFAEFGNVQAVYQPNLDMRGQDLQIHYPSGAMARLQLRVVLNDDYSKLKSVRRMRRGNDGIQVIDCAARLADLDCSAQPYLPRPEWYRNVTEMIAQQLKAEADNP